MVEHRSRRAIRVGALAAGVVLLFGAVPTADAQEAGPAVALEGVVMEVHGDDFAGNRVFHDFELHRRGHRPVRLAIDDETGRKITLRRIRVRGKMRGIILENAEITAVSTAPAISSASLAPLVAGDNRVAVLLVNFSDLRTQPWTTDQVRSAFFAPAPALSVDQYVRSSSEGQASLSGDVLGYYPIAASSGGCAYSTWATQARAAATNAGVNLANYRHTVYLFPNTGSCGWAGLANVAGGNSWINGSLSTRTIAHELGHNFGAWHSSTQSCTESGQRVTLSTSCTSNEYGDPYSIMGSSTRSHHGMHMHHFGWRPAQTVTTNGTYQLARVHSTGSPQTLRIPRGSTNTSFDLEIRQNYAPFDSYSTTDTVTQGVSVRLDGTDMRTHTQLLDMTPATTTFTDGALLPGRTFTDPQTGLSIRVDSVNAAGATVTVGMGAPDTTKPTAPTNLRTTAVGPTFVDLSWGAATDNDRVAGYRVTRGTTLLASPSGTTFSDKTAQPNTTYQYKVEAVDATGNIGPAATLSVTTPATDTSPPGAVTGLQFGGFDPSGANTYASIEWNAATDNVRVAGYRVTRDGQSKGTVVPTYFTELLPAGSTHTWTVAAVDDAGNLGSPATFTGTIPVNDTTAPSTPANVTVSTTTTSATVRWNASTDNVGVYEYALSWGTGTGGYTSGTSYTVNNLLPNTNYTFNVSAYDASGNRSGIATVTGRTQSVADTTRPSAPVNISASPSATAVALSWSAATDNVGVAGYRVKRGTTTLGNTASLAYNATGLAPGTQYTFTVEAYDAAQNVGPAATVTVTTPLGGAPSTPVLAAQLGSRGRVRLSWTASTDNTGIHHYEIQRGTWKRDRRDTTFTDRPGNGTWTYRIVAVDLEGNRSAPSNAITITVT